MASDASRSDIPPRIMICLTWRICGFEVLNHIAEVTSKLINYITMRHFGNPEYTEIIFIFYTYYILFNKFIMFPRRYTRFDFIKDIY